MRSTPSTIHRPKRGSLRSLPHRSSRMTETGRCRAKPQGVLKRWNAEFFTNRKWTDSPFIETRRDFPFFQTSEGLQAYGEDLDIFFRNDHLSGPSVEHQVVTDFFRKWDLPPSRNRKAAIRPTPARAWIDTRSSSPKYMQGSSERLNSAQLYTILNKRFPLSHFPKSFRQLVYISCMDPDAILSLANTAWHHQVEPLRDAICKHLEAETAIRVHLPINGFTVFRLEFHLCRFSLIEVPVPSHHFGELNGTGTKDVFSDLSFLGLPTDKWKRNKHVIRRSHISVMICGGDNSKWVAYAFADPMHPDDDDENEEEEEVSDEDQNDDREEVNPTEDYLASDAGLVIDADKPIWDPRVYWLIIFESQVRMISGEWKKLVYNIKKAEPQSTLEWIEKAMKLLKELCRQLSVCLRKWERFDAPDGDISYFMDLTDSRAILALANLRGFFAELVELEEKLESLNDSYKDAATIIGLRMEHESNVVNLQSLKLGRQAIAISKENYKIALRMNRVSLANNLNASLMLSTTQMVTPVVVVTSYFSTQNKIFGFPRDANSFLICVLVVFLLLKILNVATVLIRRNSRLKGMFAAILLGDLGDIGKVEDIETDEDMRQYPA